MLSSKLESIRDALTILRLTEEINQLNEEEMLKVRREAKVTLRALVGLEGEGE